MCSIARLCLAQLRILLVGIGKLYGYMEEFTKKTNRITTFKRQNVIHGDEDKSKTNTSIYSML